MPGLKPGPDPARPARGRKRRARGFGRPRAEPTARQVHALDVCPGCRVPLTGGTVARTREVIEVAPGPATVAEHVYLARRCPRCGGRWQPGPGLDGAVVGQGRLGVGLLSLVAWLHAEARLPYATIQRYLALVHGLELSAGALVGAVATVAARATPLVEALLAAIRASPVVHADETGWREDGENGYAWTLSTPSARYFVHGGRDRGVLEAALGPDFGGVLVSDFYAAYTTYAGARHQYCWAHLLRDADELARQHPADAGVRGWADALHRLFARAKAVADVDPAARVRARQGFAADLTAICAPYLPAPAAGEAPVGAGQPAAAAPPQAPLCRRIEKHLGELFVCVEDPAVPPTNNAAERSLRHLVTCRKISGGTRSAAGTDAKMALASLFGTWRAQGLNPLDQCRQLLAAPPV
jgi:transposase